jgi:hypothetical protein
MKGEPLEGQADCYYQINSTHPALGQYRQGALLMGDGRQVPVDARPGATVLADCLNLSTRENRGPAIVINQYGRGRTVYTAGSLEAHYMSSRVPSLQQILGSIIRYLAADEPVLFFLTAPKGVYGVLRHAPNGDLLLWVCANVGFKDAAVGRMRQEFVPVSNIEVRVRITAGRQLKSVHLVRAGRSVPFTVTEGYAVTKIPTLHIAELVHLKLG